MRSPTVASTRSGQGLAFPSRAEPATCRQMFERGCCSGMVSCWLVRCTRSVFGKILGGHTQKGGPSGYSKNQSKR